MSKDDQQERSESLSISQLKKTIQSSLDQIEQEYFSYASQLAKIRSQISSETDSLKAVHHIRATADDLANMVSAAKEEQSAITKDVQEKQTLQSEIELDLMQLRQESQSLVDRVSSLSEELTRLRATIRSTQSAWKEKQEAYKAQLELKEHAVDATLLKRKHELELSFKEKESELKSTLNAELKAAENSYANKIDTLRGQMVQEKESELETLQRKLDTSKEKEIAVVQDELNRIKETELKPLLEERDQLQETLVLTEHKYQDDLLEKDNHTSLIEFYLFIALTSRQPLTSYTVHGSQPKILRVQRSR